MPHQTFPKPTRGEALTEARLRRRERKSHEDREMAAAKRRDGQVCRWPRCEFRTLDLPIDAAHVVQHRQMGGNPAGDRTQRNLLMALCRNHHGWLDGGLAEIETLTVALTDGPCAFYDVNRETGTVELVAAESIIGVSATRSIR